MEPPVGLLSADHVFADLPQVRADLADEIQKRIAHQQFIALFIGVKPGAVVVFL
jgi:predicted transcriptional regulator